MTGHETEWAARYKRFLRSGEEGSIGKIQCQSVFLRSFGEMRPRCDLSKINQMWTERTISKGVLCPRDGVAIDLPLKILVWQDNQGKVWLSYDTAEYLKERHGPPEDLMQNIAVVGTFADQAGK